MSAPRTNPDPRLTPARGDLAAAHLRGLVPAKRYVEGDAARVLAGRAPLRAGPSETAGQASELLFGEQITIYDRKDGWAWVQAAQDDYVGYVRDDALGAVLASSHRVTALFTPLLPAPDMKRPALDLLPMNAKVAVLGHEGRFARIAPRGFVFADHLVPLTTHAPDYVVIAERFIGAPYIWGGKSFAGLDCSGLVQTALEAAGIAAPRDSDLQQAALGQALPVTSSLDHLSRGDLICWNGHIGIMCDGTRMVHANGHSMDVRIEGLREAAARIERSAGPITAIKRLPLTAPQ
jgi:hypothetical protein